MRDIFLLAVLPFLLYFMAQRPFIGLGMWIWTALFFPNGWVYGPASPLRYNILFTAVTVVSYLVLKHKPKFRLGATGALVLLFLLWTCISAALSIGKPGLAWEYWLRFAKVITLFVFVLLIIERKLHVDFFLWCVVLSVGFYADLESIKFLLSGGQHMIAGMDGHVLGDRNELAVAFVMTLPICVYLLGEYGRRSRIIALGLIGTIALLVIGVIGTQSRGGFISVLAFAGYFFLKSERKLPVSIAIAVMAVALSQVVSTEWLARIDTIGQASEDSSFMTRVVAWKQSFIMAVENPFFGGGMKSLEYLPVWLDLAQDFHTYTWVDTGDNVPDPTFARAAHSVYFQVLGDTGFAGLAIYLAIMFSAFRQAGRVVRKATRAKAPAWIARVAGMLQLSLVTFCVGAAALSFAYFDLIFAIIGLLIVLELRILPAAIAEAALDIKAAPAVPPTKAPLLVRKETI